MKKRCSHCKQTKDLSYFWNNKFYEDNKSTYCKDCGKIFEQNKYKKHGEQIRERERRRMQLPHNKEKQRLRWKNPKRREWAYNYRKNKRKMNIIFKLSCNLRSRIWDALHGKNKSKHTVELLGCTVDEFKTYLESKFEEGMSWENYSYTGWHLGHVIPCAAFNLVQPEEQAKCFHFSNIKPQWAKDNFKENSIFNGKKYFYT